MEWWRAFIGRGKGRAEEPEVTDPDRRRASRYEFAIELGAKCDSWSAFLSLETSDVSEGGIFVPTEEAAEIGARVQLELETQTGGVFPICGTVVHVVVADKAQTSGRRAGLGIKLDELTAEAEQSFRQMLGIESTAEPAPDKTVESLVQGYLDDFAHELTPANPPVPTGRAVRVSGLHAAISEEAWAASGARPIEEPEPEPPPKPIEPPPEAPAIVRPTDDVVVGIDLGTTHASVAAIIGSKITVLAWAEGVRSAPAVVSFPEQDECIVGMGARLRLATDPKHTIASPKRLLGRRYDDPEVLAAVGRAPYKTFAGPDESIIIEMWDREYAVPQLCSFILAEARDLAERTLGREVWRCVMTIPVRYTERQAKLLRLAGELARLEVVALIDEPCAAALANRFDRNFQGLVGVYEFGGGTFDFSVVDVSTGDLKVLAIVGDPWLGGDDFDTAMADAAANQFWGMHNVDLRKSKVDWQRLLFACERAKRILSVEEEVTIHVPDVFRSAKGSVDVDILLDRATFEGTVKPIIDRSLEVCDEALAQLDIEPGDLSVIFLSGGATYVPAVRRALVEHFGIPVRTGVPPEHTICLGAAIHAAQIQLGSPTTLAPARRE